MANRLTQFKLEIPTMTNNQGQVVEVPGMRPIKVLQSTLPRPRVIYNNGNNLVLKLDDAIFNTGVNNEVGVIMKRLTPILTPHNTTTELIEQISRHNRQIGRELKYLRRLNHQHLIKMHYCYPHEDTRDDFRALYVYMPWYGAALDKVMNQLGLEHVPFITYQLLNAVAFLHSANILHRDIKVENILCNEACVIKLIDYGLSRVDDGVDQTQYVVTRYYRAPELLLYRPYTKSVDMWAIGCVVAELLTRQKLFLTNAVGEGEHIRQLRKIVELAGDDATRAWMLNEYPVLTENGGVVAQSIFVGERIMVPDGMSATDYIHRVTTRTRQEEAANATPDYNQAVADGARFCSQLLKINPDERLNAVEASTHPFVIGQYPDYEAGPFEADAATIELFATDDPLGDADGGVERLWNIVTDIQAEIIQSRPDLAVANE